uniref:GLOBIN domain-containing protein n=1 Tax=Parastrongyloides trichosuri TaxID=131310 RepID=A0A0N4ZKK4_PARTI
MLMNEGKNIRKNKDSPNTHTSSNSTTNIEMQDFNELKIKNDNRRYSESGFTNIEKNDIDNTKNILSTSGVTVYPKPSTTTYYTNHNMSLRYVGRSKTDPGDESLKDNINDIEYVDKNDEESGKNYNKYLQTDCGSLPFFSMAPNRCECPISRDRVDSATKPFELQFDSSIVRPKTLSEVIGLSNYQQKLILQCWPNIYTTGAGSTFASNIYPNLCSKNAKAKALLQKADGVAVFSNSEIDCTTMHSKLTLELMDSVVKNFDSNPLPLISYLQETGHYHRNLKLQGMNMSMWDDFGDAILDGVRKNDLVRKHKELRRAWLAIIAFLTDNLKQGQNSFRVSPSTQDIQLCSNINCSLSNTDTQ